MPLAPADRRAHRQLNPANIEELKSAVAAILKKYNVPGVGIALVTKDAVVWTGGVGKADLATNRDVTGDTMFRVGSITKGFVALSALQLAERGKLRPRRKSGGRRPRNTGRQSVAMRRIP